MAQDAAGPVECWGPLVADAFISYAREDHAPAARLAAVFEAAGWDVWWDREILAGQSFDEVIEHELAAAKVVIVLWSEHSVTSSWVRAEANDALDRGILIPALLTQVTMPLAFRRAQAANLITWQGQPNHDGLESLILSMEAKLGPRRRAAAAPAGNPPTPAPAPPARPATTPLAVIPPPAVASSSTAPPPAPGTGTGTGDGTRPRSGTGDGRPVAAAGAGATTVSSSGDGGATGIVAALWGTTEKRQRTLIGGGVAVALLLVIAFFTLGRGGGAPATITVRPESLDFTVRSGETTIETLELTNDGDETARDLRWSVTGSLFSIENSSCPLTLDPGVHCELTILFDARESSEPASVSELLRIDGVDAGVTVQLTGAITGTRAFGIVPEAVDFGPVATATAKVVSVTNDGDTPLRVVARLDGAGFEAANDCTAEVAPGTRCTVTVTVAGSAGGSATGARSPELSAVLVITAAGLPERRVALTASLLPVEDSARITGITLSGSSYAVSFETTGFTPALPGQHVHFFFDSVLPLQAGVPGRGPWYVYGGGSPFTGYGSGDRPGGASSLCVLVANADHTVQLDTGNCTPLP